MREKNKSTRGEEIPKNKKKSTMSMYDDPATLM